MTAADVPQFEPTVRNFPRTGPWIEHPNLARSCPVAADNEARPVRAKRETPNGLSFAVNVRDKCEVFPPAQGVPNFHFSCESAGDSLSVGAERHAGDLTRAPDEVRDLLAIGRVPDFYSLVPPPADDPLRVATVRDAFHFTHVPGESQEFAATRRIPDFKCLVGASADDPASVGIECHAIYVADRSLNGQDRFTS